MEIVLYIVACIGLGAAAVFVLALTTMFFKIRRELIIAREDKIVEQHALVQIELVKQDNLNLILVYDAITDQFVCQAETAEAVIEKIRDVYKNKKSISLLSINNEVLPLTAISGVV